MIFLSLIFCVTAFSCTALLFLWRDAASTEVAWQSGVTDNRFVAARYSTVLTAVSGISLLLLSFVLYRNIRFLEYSEAEGRTILKTAMDGFWITDMEGRFLEVNNAFCAISGFTRKELLSMRISDIEASESSETTKEHIRKIMISGQDSFESKHRRRDGRVINVEINVNYLPIAGGRMVVFVRNVTKKKLREQRLLQLSTAVEQSPTAILITAADGAIEYANRKFFELTGYTPDEAIGQNPRFLKAGDQPEEHYREMWERISSGNEWQGEFHNRAKDGRLFWEMAYISPIRDISGLITHFVAVKEDITERKLMEGKLTLMAHFDPLTGLPNRALFFDRVETAVNLARREKRRCAVMFLDLDGFKGINDTYGHETGDRLLCKIAGILKNSLRSSDTVARMGGDEFTILLYTMTNHNDAALVSQNILDILSHPLRIDDHICRIGASIGIAIFPDDAKEVEELVHGADTAMYSVKKSGKNNFGFFVRETSDENSTSPV